MKVNRILFLTYEKDSITRVSEVSAHKQNKHVMDLADEVGDCKRGRFSVVFARKIIEITNDYERFYERDIIRRLFFVKEAAKNQGGNNY